jgi:hypothetical protein
MMAIAAAVAVAIAMAITVAVATTTAATVRHALSTLRNSYSKRYFYKLSYWRAHQILARPPICIEFLSTLTVILGNTAEYCLIDRNTVKK